MAKLKCSVLLLLCATCTLTSASIKEELKFLSKDAPVIRTQRQAYYYSKIDQLIPDNYKEIADRFENTVDACNDAYSIVCSDNPTIEKETINLKFIKKSILDILNTSLSKHDFPLLDTEKTLFHNCMNLGNEDYFSREQTLADFEYVVHRIYNHVKFHTSWQSLDAFLSSLGFGHAFYEIKVERDPENSVNNIVTIQPPSYARLERLSVLIRRILDSSNDHVNDEGWNIWKFFETMKRSKNDINSFFVSLLQITSGKGSQNKYVEKTTLNKWQRSNNLHSSDVAQVNWTKVISQEFEKVHVNIDINDENLLVKNEQYFFNLYELLNTTSSNLISSVILTKMLAEQLPYVDWEGFHAVNPLANIVSKEEFCFGETKLYGASYVALQSFKDTNINGISSKTTFNTLNNIVSVIHADISGTYTLTTKQRRYLKNELSAMTMNILQQQDAKAVGGYYEDYRTIGIYFTDVLNYRKMIRNKELSTLRDAAQSSMDDAQLYSITDLYKPRNRLLTKLLTINMTIDVPMHRVIYYSKYAPDVAQFIYSLLNENKFIDYKHDFEGAEELQTYPIFSASIIDCYWNAMNLHDNQNKKFVKHMLTTMFGLRMAYEAMLNDYAVIGVSPKDIQVSDNNWISHDKLFFLSYLKTHCSLGSNILNEIFSKSDFIHTSMCISRSNDVTGCKQEPFGIQSKHIFLS